MSEIKIGLIGGSGLADLLRDRAAGTRRDVQTPFGPPSDAIVETTWEGLPVLFLSRHGPGHLLNPSQVPYRANIFALKTLGCTHIIASGAVGSLREEFKPRDLVIPDQIIDKTHRRANTFYEHAAVHVEFAEPFCPVLRRLLTSEGDDGTGGHGEGEKETPNQPVPHDSPVPSSPSYTVHSRGCYVAMEGPAFSTRAESLMHRLWGGDLIGMTCMPEAKLAREAEISYALIALVTDYDCWRRPAAAKEAAGPADPGALLKEIIANLRAASDNAASLIARVLRRVAADPQVVSSSPAQEALKLAIWSDKAGIQREQVDSLAPLWKKYFGSD